MKSSWLEGCPNPCGLSFLLFSFGLQLAYPLLRTNLWVLEIHCSFGETVVHVCVCVCVCVSRSVMSDSAIPCTIAHQAPLYVEFSRQEYWSELPFPSLGALPNPEIEPRSPTWQADSLLSESPGKSMMHIHLSEFKVFICHVQLTLESHLVLQLKFCPGHS